MPTYLGLDLGTTASKAVVLGSDGAVIAHSRVEHVGSRAGAPGRVNPEAWADSLVTACRRLGATIAGVSAVGLSVHSPVVVAYDGDGTPLADGIAWTHPELPRRVRELQDPTGANFSWSGNERSPATFMIAAAALLVEENALSRRRGIEVGTASSWLYRRLTGVSAIDPTQASFTGAYATTTSPLAWFDSVASVAGVTPSLLPVLRESLSAPADTARRAADEFGLPVGIPVIVGAADTPAAAFVTGTHPGGRPLFSIGTTHVLTNSLDVPDPRARALQRSGVRADEWLIHGATNGGDSLAAGAQALGYGTGGASVGSLIDDAFATSALGAPEFIPHVLPERGPLWIGTPQSALVGLSPATTREQAARAVLEGVLFVDRLVIESCVTRHQTGLHLAGTFADSSPMPQVLADAFQRPVHVLNEPSLSALGAAAMALEAIERRHVPVPASWSVEPNPERTAEIEDRWQHYRETWRESTGQPVPEPLTVSLFTVPNR